MVRADIKSILRLSQSQLKQAYFSIPKEAPQAARRKIIYRMKNDFKLMRNFINKEPEYSLEFIKQAKKEVYLIGGVVMLASIITIVYKLGKIFLNRIAESKEQEF